MWIRALVLTAVSSLILACSTGYAPVSEQSLGAIRSTPVGVDEYRVRPGDTLIAIAFRLGVDYRDLIGINNLKDQDLIYSGQVLKTKSSPSRTPVSRSSTPANRTQQITATPTQSSTPVASNNPRPIQTPPNIPSSSIKWSWPHAGKILARFSTREGGNKGVDLSGRIGDPIKAAAAGQVVYAGSGLLGYGNLVIISHNRDFLSAYAHNSRILVKENQKVKAGQVLAELGNTGASVPMLHFEIRRDGKPVDPLGYLPKR